MIIIGIDPGPLDCAFLIWESDSESILAKGWVPSFEIIDSIPKWALRWSRPRVAIEMVACYGMAVGREVFQTCVVIGRISQQCANSGLATDAIERGPIKMHFCHSMRAKDANIRQALIDRFGEPGTKKAPGKLYGVSKHLWSALAIAVYAGDTKPKEIEKAKEVLGL